MSTAAPVAVATLRVGDGRTVHQGLFRVFADRLEAELDGEDEVRVEAADALGRIVARLTGLGPRPRAAAPPEGAAVLEREDLEAVLAGRADAPVDDAWGAFLEALAGSLAVRWRVDVLWSEAGEGPDRTLEVLDAGPAGLAVLADAREPGFRSPVALAPATPTEVWHALCRLLPTDDELAESLT
jgi:hypothetical protein